MGSKVLMLSSIIIFNHLKVKKVCLSVHKLFINSSSRLPILVVNHVNIIWKHVCQFCLHIMGNDSGLHSAEQWFLMSWILSYLVFKFYNIWRLDPLVGGLDHVIGSNCQEFLPFEISNSRLKFLIPRHFFKL